MTDLDVITDREHRHPGMMGVPSGGAVQSYQALSAVLPDIYEIFTVNIQLT
jgi:hypothetical protein